MVDARSVPQHFAGLLVFLFPILILNVDHWSSTIHVLLVLLAFSLPFLPRGPGTDAIEKRVLLAIGVFLAVLFLNFLLVDSGDFNYSRLRRYGRLLLAIPSLYVILRLNPRKDWLWYGICVGAILTGLTGFFQELWQGPGARLDGRANGNANPIIYGDISVCLAFLSGASLPFFLSQKPRWQWLLPALGIVCGLLGCYFAKTRGAWLALPVVLILYAWLYRRYLNPQRIALIFASVLCAVVLALSIPQVRTQLRLKQAFSDVMLYASGENRHTSVGARFEMWKTAIDIFQEHPLLGAGAGEFKRRMVQGVAEGRFPQSYAHLFSEPHSEYMAALSSRGIIGLGALLFLLFVPLWEFMRAFGKYPVAGITAGAGGAILLASFMVFSLTASVLEMTRLMTFFAFYLAAFTAWHGHELRDMGKAAGKINSP
jgi:O-antigen ligase